MNRLLINKSSRLFRYYCLGCKVSKNFKALPTCYVWIRVYPQSVRKRNKVCPNAAFIYPFKESQGKSEWGYQNTTWQVFIIGRKNVGEIKVSAKKFPAFLRIGCEDSSPRKRFFQKDPLLSVLIWGFELGWFSVSPLPWLLLPLFRFLLFPVSSVSSIRSTHCTKPIHLTNYS